MNKKERETLARLQNAENIALRIEEMKKNHDSIPSRIDGLYRPVRLKHAKSGKF